MDLDDLAEYTTLKTLANFSRQEFVDQCEVRVGRNTIDSLLKIHHLVETKGSCWDKDISDIAPNPTDVITKRASIGNWYSGKNNLIRQVGNTHKYLGKNWILTNKGKFMLQRYVAWTREKERQYFYRVKKSRVIAKEIDNK
jgi:hypothetical protein